MAHKPKITFRLNEKDKIILDNKADQLKLSRTKLLIKAIESILEFDNDFIKKIDSIAEGVDLSFAEVMQGFVTKRLAEIDAHLEVWGGQVLLEELIKTDQGVPDQKYLYETLKENIKKPMIQEKIQDLIQEKIKDLLKSEQSGVELTEPEKEFLIENKKGQTRKNPEEYIKQIEEEKRSKDSYIEDIKKTKEDGYKRIRAQQAASKKYNQNQKEE